MMNASAKLGIATTNVRVYLFCFDGPLAVLLGLFLRILIVGLVRPQRVVRRLLLGLRVMALNCSEKSENAKECIEREIIVDTADINGRASSANLGT